jgi:O-antigen/teichoic acid export membrane protein
MDRSLDTSYKETRSFKLGLVLRRTSWSLVDQGVVSLGAFFVNIMLARKLSSPEYGVFVLLFTVALNLQHLNTCLIAYPLGVRLASAKGAERARLSASSVVLAAAFCVPLAGLIGVGLAGFRRSDLVIPAIAWFVFWQIQQSTRRTLLADLSHRDAVAGDVLGSLGQGLAVGIVASIGQLSLASALYCMAAASALGAIQQVVKLRLDLNDLYGPRRWLTQNAALGVWSLGTVLIATLRVQILFWLLAVTAGTAVVASLQAALNIFFVLNPIWIGLASVILQVAAFAYVRGDRLAAWHAARPYLLVALPPTLIYVAFSVMFSPFLLWVFYGSGSPYLQLGDLVLPLAVFAASMMATELIISYMLGVEEARLALKVNLVGAAAVAVLVGPLIATFGTLHGTCWTLAASDFIRLAATLVYLRRLIGGDSVGRGASKTDRRGSPG